MLFINRRRNRAKKAIKRSEAAASRIAKAKSIRALRRKPA